MLAPPRLRPSRLRLAQGVSALVAVGATAMRNWCIRAGVIAASALASATMASACGWWGDCDYGRRYNAYGSNAYGYAYSYSRGYNYYYTPPARVYGYAPRPTPPPRPGPNTVVAGAPPSPAGDMGLQAPFLTHGGVQASAMPSRGPTLFGPPSPPAFAYGYSSGSQRMNRRYRHRSRRSW